MSNEVHEEIDLNSDAVPINQENVSNDLNVRELASGAAAVTEGLVDGGVNEFGEDKVLAHRVDELGNKSKIESVKIQGIDLEADMGSLGEVVDGKASVGLSSGGVSPMEVDGGSRGTGDGDGDGGGESVSKKPVEAEQMAVKTSGGVTEDLNVNNCPNKDSLVEGNSVQSTGDEDGDGESFSIENKKPVEAAQMAVGSSGGVTEDLNVNDFPNEDTVVEGTSARSSSIVDNTIHSGDENCLPCGDQIMSSKEGFSAGSRKTGDGESVSMEEKTPLEGEQMAVGSSGEVTHPEGLNFSECPNEDSLVEGTSVRSSSIADNTIHSGDEKPHQSSSPLGDQKMSSKEGSPAGLESCDMEIDTPEETKKSRATRRDFWKAGNRFDVFDDVIDLNQCTSSDADASSDVDAKSEEPEFCVSDLVWAKVRSHPWWPAQIFDRSAATPKANKYFKRGCYLVAYYYDQTFAWNEASQIKPFRPHFSRMEKQTNMEEFHLAVDCSLDEVSRRVEFGLACSCISEEAYDKVKAEIIVNAGIRKESSRRDGGDRFSGAASFDTSELVETMKTLALSPTYSEVGKLQFTISRAQLLAFNRWKGYSELPEFQNLHGLLEIDAEIPLSEEVKKCSEVIVNEVPNAEVDEKVLSEKEKSDSRDGSSSKQKNFLTISDKKEKSLSEFLAERRLSLQNGKRKLNSKGGDKLISSSPAKKLKAVEPVCDDSAKKQNKSSLSTASVNKSLQSKKLKAVEPVCDVSAVKQNKSNSSTGSIDKSLQSMQTFRVGASILKVASLLNGSTFSSPILKHSDGTPPKSAVNNKSKGKALSGKSRKKKVSQTDTSSSDETSPKSAVNNRSKGKASSGKSRKKKVSQTDTSSSDEMLSQLCSAATDPLKGYNFLSPLVYFFTELRNSIAMDLNISEMSEQSLEQGSDAIMGEKSNGFKLMGKSDFTSIKDSSCFERIIQCLPEEQLTVDTNKQTMEIFPSMSSEKGDLVVESQSAATTCANEDEQKHAVIDENLGTEGEDVSPTALILKFSDIDSVPSVEELNKIFGHYGPLVTRGTEVLKKSIQAKVHFKKREDAETAFSSSGKYSLFGHSLVSYRLKRLASTPTKASHGARRRSKAGETGGD